MKAEQDVMRCKECSQEHRRGLLSDSNPDPNMPPSCHVVDLSIFPQPSQSHVEAP
jgi:hypothetical protein